ncbi:MAG: hypothetical protein AAGF19_04455 [Pseudomonadota bacterium]
MKKILGLTTAAMLFAAPAFGAVITIEFAEEGGETISYAFDDSTMTVTNLSTDESFPYTYDEAAKTVCGEAAAGKICATFENTGEEVGFTTPYTNTEGAKGTATITAVE